jgi:small subunit ribosomal protein S3Ae
MATAAPMKKSKVVDKWKSKQWYTILAPASFDSKEIGEVVSSDEDNLKNRIVSLSLAEVTGQPSQSAIFTSLRFRIGEVKGKSAYTKLIGHEISPSYIKTLSRRNRSIISVVYDIKTKDDQSVRAKILAISGSEISQNTKKNIYHAIMEELKKVGAEYNSDQLMQEIIFGKFASKIFNRLKQITAMRRVEVRKSEVKETFA